MKSVKITALTGGKPFLYFCGVFCFPVTSQNEGLVIPTFCWVAESPGVAGEAPNSPGVAKWPLTLSGSGRVAGEDPKTLREWPSGRRAPEKPPGVAEWPASPRKVSGSGRRVPEKSPGEASEAPKSLREAGKAPKSLREIGRAHV